MTGGNDYYKVDEQSLLRRELDAEMSVRATVPKRCDKMNNDGSCYHDPGHAYSLA
jgi:hypothetical protein